MWKAHKQAFGAIGRISPSYYVQDGVIPRSKLPEVLAKIEKSGKAHGLVTANVFHAGDGNLHPLILFDERKPDEVEHALACNAEVLEAVIAAGGGAVLRESNRRRMKSAGPVIWLQATAERLSERIAADTTTAGAGLAGEVGVVGHRRFERVEALRHHRPGQSAAVIRLHPHPRGRTGAGQYG